MRIKAYPASVTLLALFAAGCETMPLPQSRSASDPVSEAVGVQELRREVAELRDTVEVQRNELGKLQERQRQLYDDLDYRLRQREQAAGVEQGGAGYGQQAGQGTGQSSQSQVQVQSRSTTQSQQQTAPATQQEQDEVYGQQGVSQSPDQDQQQAPAQQTQVEAPSQQASVSQPSTAPTQQQGSGQAAVAGTDEQAAYDNAFELLKQSRYNDAIIDFQALTTQFPNGALVDDAQYWIGEAYYVTRDFENALDAFRTVVNQYPDSQRVPEAMLKQGYVQAELGRTQEARQTLNQVISQYPGSRVAISAETRLNKIR